MNRTGNETAEPNALASLCAIPVSLLRLKGPDRGIRQRWRELLLGFKRQFAPFVENGSKTHTVRAVRKIRPKPGEICHCYVDPRQKTMRLLGRWPCVKVEDIQISVDPPALGYRLPLTIRLGHELLDASEVEAFLFRDGFRDYRWTTHADQAYEFWKDRLPFRGVVIHWDYSKPFMKGRA